jgi:hypothetical protein
MIVCRAHRQQQVGRGTSHQQQCNARRRPQCLVWQWQCLRHAATKLE